MFTRIRTTVLTNYKLILVTFELFWIMVFLLDRLSRGSLSEVPQFVYVNF